ncbi:MAG: ATP-binding protein [Gammaproteobacteria bacterium]|nr:ATP-binding protein [Gammaproteobacteria bacterium]
MDIDLADVVIHIDQNLNLQEREALEKAFRQREGVVSVHFAEKNPHLVTLEYNPKQIRSRDLVDIPRFQGFHGELVGL